MPSLSAGLVASHAYNSARARSPSRAAPSSEWSRDCNVGLLCYGSPRGCSQAPLLHSSVHHLPCPRICIADTDVNHADRSVQKAHGAVGEADGGIHGGAGSTRPLNEVVLPAYRSSVYTHALCHQHVPQGPAIFLVNGIALGGSWTGGGGGSGIDREHENDATGNGSASSGGRQSVNGECLYGCAIRCCSKGRTEWRGGSASSVCVCVCNATIL